MVARERIAWIDLVGMLLAYGFFFTAFLRDERTPLTLVILFAIATAVRLAILAGAYLTLSAEGRGELRGRPDERDRAVSRRAGQAAYYVLLLSIIVIVFMAFDHNGISVATAGLAGLVGADVVRTAVTIAGYHWGWRG